MADNLLPGGQCHLHERPPLRSFFLSFSLWRPIPFCSPREKKSPTNEAGTGDSRGEPIKAPRADRHVATSPFPHFPFVPASTAPITAPLSSRFCHRVFFYFLTFMGGKFFHFVHRCHRFPDSFEFPIEVKDASGFLACLQID